MSSSKVHESIRMSNDYSMWLIISGCSCLSRLRLFLFHDHTFIYGTLCSNIIPQFECANSICSMVGNVHLPLPYYQLVLPWDSK